MLSLELVTVDHQIDRDLCEVYLFAVLDVPTASGKPQQPSLKGWASVYVRFIESSRSHP